MAAPDKRFVLTHQRSPGDIICMTSLVRDIHLTYPGQFETDVQTTCPDLWRHNPYITRLFDKEKKSVLVPGTRFIKLTYGKGIQEQNKETIHFASYFHRDFKLQTGIEVPVQLPYGDLHLSEEERTVPLIEGKRYWVIISGGKSDFTIKVWRSDYFQQVTDRLNNMGLGVVQIGSVDSGHWHPKLNGTLDLIGQTNLRDMMRLIYHADGVICGVTAAMHMAAALQRPCVCIAGGREAWWWEAYVNENMGFGAASGKLAVPHQYLHTIGMLDCCRHHGCWRNKVVPMHGDRSTCKLPVFNPGQPMAKCMDMITPDHVIGAVMKNYQDRTLPPIDVVSPHTPETDGLPLHPPEPAAPPSLLDVAKNGAEPACSRPATRHKTSTRASVVVPKGAKIRINPKAKLETRGAAKAAQPVAQKPGTTPDYSDEKIFDHPLVGGKFTVFVLLYGGEELHGLHKRCLESLIGTMPAGRMELRVGSNALCKSSLDMIKKFQDEGKITLHYEHKENAWKYPVMREMFHDPEHPIETKWVLWFDDDTICDVEPNWAFILAQHISQHHGQSNQHMFGAKFTWTTNQKQREVMQARPWFKGRPWRAHNGKPSPNGNKIIFATGGFWAITDECIKKADIPDLGTGLTHTGGDWQIGEQVYQAGFSVKQFNGNKRFVRTSSVDRRGDTMPTIDKAEAPAPPQVVERAQTPVRESTPQQQYVPAPQTNGDAPRTKKLPKLIQL